MSAEDCGKQLMHIDHVNLVVDDLEPARDFFVGLGFEVTGGGPLRGAWVEAVMGIKDVDAEFVALALPMGQAALELLEFKQPTGEDDPSSGKPNRKGYGHIALAVKDIEGWHSRLEEMDIECLSSVQDVPNYKGKRMFYFLGPEDNLVELAEYPD